MSDTSRKYWQDAEKRWEPSSSHHLLRDCCAIAFGVSRAMVAGRARARCYSAPRQVACLALQEAFPRLSTPMIGQVIGRDHSTVVHSIRIARRKTRHDIPFAAKVDALVEIGRAIARRSVDGREARALAYLLAPEPEAQTLVGSEWEPGPETETDTPGGYSEPLFVVPVLDAESAREAQLRAAIQADIDAEADAALRRCARNEAEPFRDVGQIGRKGAAEAEAIAQRRRAREAERRAHERFWLQREARPLGRASAPRPLSEMPV